MVDRAKDTTSKEIAYDQRIAVALIDALSHKSPGISPDRRLALVLELWQRTKLDWGFVTDRLSVAFRENTWLGAHERRFVAETVFGLVRGVRRLDAALAAAAPAVGRSRIGDGHRLVAYWLEQGFVGIADAARFDPSIQWAEVAAFRDRGAQTPLREQVAVGQSMPDWLADAFLADWHAEALALAEALSARAPMTVRANLLKTAPRELQQALAAQDLPVVGGRWSDTSLTLLHRVNLFGLDAFRAGHFEAQDEGSQILADVAFAAAGNKPKLIVDYCAGAGGKTLAIAARMSNKGRLVSTDVDERKLLELKKRARRAGVSNHQALTITADGWPDALHRLRGTADCVLVDAPCSGVGALRRNPEAKWRLQPGDIAQFVAKQRDITRRAAALVRPGGALLYATCSVLAAENRAQAKYLEAELRGFSREVVVGVASELLDDDGNLALAPHRTGTDGFFAAMFRRHETETA